MKKTSSLVLVLLLCLNSLTMVFAQPPKGERGPEKAKEHFEKQTERLTKALDLTADQIKQFEAINSESLTKIEADKEKAKELRDKFKSIMDERMSKLENVLTADQKTKFKKIRAKMEKKMEEKKEERMEHRKKDK